MNPIEKLKSLFDRKPVAPRFTLTDADKVYLAVAVKHTKELSFVYSLTCAKDKSGQILMNPTTNIASYDSRRKANIVHATIQEMMHVQEIHLGVRAICEVYKDRIEQFMQHTK